MEKRLHKREKKSLYFFWCWLSEFFIFMMSVCVCSWWKLMLKMLTPTHIPIYLDKGSTKKKLLLFNYMKLFQDFLFNQKVIFVYFTALTPSLPL